VELPFFIRIFVQPKILVLVSRKQLQARERYKKTKTKMKYAEFNIDSNKIEFWNSFFGIESVLLNGKRISKKFSFSGITHEIKLHARDLILESKYKQFDKKETPLALVCNECHF
jgi:hypothetical protein